MNQKLKAKHCKGIEGISDTSTVKLDFDNMQFKTAQHYAFKILRLFRSRKTDKWTPEHKINLEGFLIRKSSPKHYHIIYNKTVSWLENLEVVAWACLLTHKIELMQWFVMQTMKCNSTLRIGRQGDKSAPRTVYTYGKQDCEIRNFLKIRRKFRNV
jgi:hypothetical protein